MLTHTKKVLWIFAHLSIATFITNAEDEITVVSKTEIISSNATEWSYNLQILSPTRTSTNSTLHLFVSEKALNEASIDALKASVTENEMIVAILDFADASDLQKIQDLTAKQKTGIPGSGYAHKFTSFIKKELIQYIETNLGLSFNRIALHSNGVCSIWAFHLFFSPESFAENYVMHSPAMTWYLAYPFTAENNFYSTLKAELPRNLTITLLPGDNDQAIRIPAKQFDQILSIRKYKQLNHRMIDGEKWSINDEASMIAKVMKDFKNQAAE